MVIVKNILEVISAIIVLIWTVKGLQRWWPAVTKGQVVQPVSTKVTINPWLLGLFFLIMLVGVVAAVYTMINNLPPDHIVNIIASIAFNIWVISIASYELATWKREAK